MQLIEQVASDEVIEQAFLWICLKRKEHSHNNDVWNLRRHWQTVKPDLQKQLLDGTYQFSPQQEIRFDTETIELWASLDALVLKAVTLVLTRHLKPHISNQCVHVKGNGGGKEAVRQITKQLKGNSFVFRSDVKGYYASIDHHVLMEQLRCYIDDSRVIILIWDYLNRTVQFGGLYRDIKRGISLGCPLSPLIGALYLKLMDDRMEKTGLFYVRFMDDWIVLSPNRWKLKKAIQIVNQTLNELKVEKHPDKTFIGRLAKGFDFLGYSFEPKGLSIASKTLANFLDRKTQLYEQGADVRRIGQYVRNWLRWVRAGVVISDEPKTPKPVGVV